MILFACLLCFSLFFVEMELSDLFKYIAVYYLKLVTFLCNHYFFK